MEESRTLASHDFDAQIKTRARVRELAEVYTHEREVRAMLDLVPDMFPSEAEPGNIDRKFLEPACGSGNFLEEILRRKLSTVTTRRYGRGENYEHRVLRCLASIYGIDVDAENVAASRLRMRAIVASHLDNDSNTFAPSAGLTTAVESILATNIIQANTLRDGQRIELIDYRPTRIGKFVREWSFLEARELSLFDDLAAGRRDEVALHYRDLASTPNPTKSAR